MAANVTTEAKRQVRVLLADDHHVVRMGLVRLFQTVPGFNVVAQAATAAEAVAWAHQTRPDVAILDMRLPDSNGAEVCRRILLDSPATRVLILTSYDEPEGVEAALTAGATGYVMKETPVERLIQAIELVAEGRMFYDQVAAQAVVDLARRTATQGQGDLLGSLRPQDWSILSLIAEGKTNKQIASTLYLSEHTVKTYISTIFKKLHVNRRSEAAARVARSSEALAPPGPTSSA